MSQIRKRYVFLAISLFCFFAYVAGSEATTITAVSCSQNDVQRAINMAFPGDTVNVPAGNCIWTSEVEIGKALSIIGAGSGIGGTELTGSGADFNRFFTVAGFSSSDPVRISGFKFILPDNVAYGILISSSVDLTSLRIDHNIFHHGHTQIYVAGSKGVIDNNYFYNGIKGVQFTAGTNTAATASWASMEAGTGDAIFIENNHFIMDGNYMPTSDQEDIGTHNGGKLVIRYNEFDSDNNPLSVTSSAIETHGNARAGASCGYWQAGAGARRGQSVVEIYENLIHGKRVDKLATIRGSANLIYNNTASSEFAAPYIRLREEEYYESSNWSPVRTAWPAEDQVHNTFIWGNTFNGSSDQRVSAENYIEENRDYFKHRPAKLGEGMTLGIETFTGANGASSSYPTDGTTYPTLGTIVFTPDVENAYYGYTPYTYPHPLRKPSSPNPRIGN